jgi:hypothetical protein
MHIGAGNRTWDRRRDNFPHGPGETGLSTNDGIGNNTIILTPEMKVLADQEYLAIAIARIAPENPEQLYLQSLPRLSVELRDALEQQGPAIVEAGLGQLRAGQQSSSVWC